MNKVNPIVIELLKKRGISAEGEMLEFLSEKPIKTYDPFLLLNMEAGVDFLLSAIERNKRICIYGDYDADGITSISLLREVLSRLTQNLDYYVPSRFDEGYGLNNEAIDTIKQRGGEFIITVDCGSVSYEEVEHAKDIGIEIMVTDHHSITDKKADCILINPKQEECTYPFKELAGCGVAFKLAQALQKRCGLGKDVLIQVLDLVALGTIGDIVPLVDENRTMVKYGMKQIMSGKRPGLTALLTDVGIAPVDVKSDQIAFVVVPHLNAAGRMMDAAAAVELLCSRSESVILPAVKRLVENNKERKRVQAEAYKKCAAIAEEFCCDDKLILVDCPDAHEGITGIVAGKLKDRYYKPVLIVTPSGEFIKGTGRSIESINLYRLLKNCDDIFEKFGGHAGACGFLMRRENLDSLKTRVELILENMLLEDQELYEKRQQADMCIAGKDITFELVSDLELLSPFGNQNPKPSFEIAHVMIEKLYYMGEDNQHVRFTGKSVDGAALSCVMFNKAGERRGLLQSGLPVRLIGSADCQEWNGSKRLQFLVEDIFENSLDCGGI